MSTQSISEYLDELIRNLPVQYLNEHALLGDAAQPEDTFLDDPEFQCYQWLYAVGKTYCPRNILEFGVRYGYAGIALLLGAKAACGCDNFTYLGIDSEFDGIRSNSIARASLKTLNESSSVIPLETDSPYLPTFLREYKKFDLVYVDADHSEEGIRRELRLAVEFSDPDTGIILVDDTDTRHIREATLDVAYNLGIEPLTLPTFHGTMLLDRRWSTFARNND